MGLSMLTIIGWGVQTITSTAFSHVFNRKKTFEECQLRREFGFDEGFHIVKDFLARASDYAVEDLQKFGSTYTPSPPWVQVIRTIIPSSICAEAASYLVKGMGDEEINDVIGGKEWWQRRPAPSNHRPGSHSKGRSGAGEGEGENGGEKMSALMEGGGIEGEWIAMKKDWKAHEEEYEENLRNASASGSPTASASASGSKNGLNASSEEFAGEGVSGIREGSEESYSQDMDCMRCMLYIHGGAYFFGSINTHRYTIWRYARKMGGRAFAVRYRLAPQYPFPCALQDALASYLYLIRPPPEAKHRPVDPSKIVIAGDSAGGGLALALLCLIRDVGLPMPAGGVLISPWCDLTHSFPSILQNTKTDIIPPYGFLYRPSTLWPPPSPELRKVADEKTSLQSIANASEVISESLKRHVKHPFARATTKTDPNIADAAAAKLDEGKLADHDGDVKEGEGSGKPADRFVQGQRGEGQPFTQETGAQQDKTEPEAITIVKVDGKDVEIDEQIQLYATNEQLTHPFVSPALQPSLGGLCPLYIIAGDKEVLRDEIIYVAHRAAHPDKYPLRPALREANAHRMEQAAKYPPTKVHLAVYDDACHVLPLFSFTTPAKYCYRAIASFCKYVTADASEIPPSPISPHGMALPLESSPPTNVIGVEPTLMKSNESPISSVSLGPVASSLSPNAYNSRSLMNEGRSDVDEPDEMEYTSSPQGSSPVTPRSMSGANDSSSTQGRQLSLASEVRSRKHSRMAHRKKSRERTITPKEAENLKKTIYHSLQPFNRPPFVDHMIRERVSINGVIRPLNPESELQALNVDPEDIGVIKEGPVKRWLEGKELWDKRFKKSYERVKKQRAREIKRSVEDEEARIKRMLSNLSHRPPNAGTDGADGSDDFAGVWTLKGEHPPPSSIAARKDTAEARKLASALEGNQSRLHPLAFWVSINQRNWIGERDHPKQRGHNSANGSEAELPKEAKTTPEEQAVESAGVGGQDRSTST